MDPKFFKTSAELRNWFEKNHHKEKELWVGYYKKDSGLKSITWSESVDQALCFGWIDGIRKSIDEKSYTNRFTPRKPGSNWSAININKVNELTKLGLMKPAGTEAFKKLDKKKAKVYSFEQRSIVLNPAFEKIFKSNKTAWKSFTSMAPSYQRVSIHWVMSAKQEETRLRRLNILIEDSANNIKIKPLRIGKESG
ncbi:MAG: YdeI/OmpD-associated family protein [Ignavibacteriales bacterium]|nr:MAG: YdeI/OmpD-associated family protein [Ignavibacteriales bacterium]